MQGKSPDPPEDGECLGYMEMDAQSGVFPADQRAFPHSTVLPWPESTSTRWWVTAQRAVTGHRVGGAERRENFTSSVG